MLNGEFSVFIQYRIKILPSTKNHIHTIHYNAVYIYIYEKNKNMKIFLYEWMHGCWMLKHWSAVDIFFIIKYIFARCSGWENYMLFYSGHVFKLWRRSSVEIFYVDDTPASNCRPYIVVGVFFLKAIALWCSVHPAQLISK